MVVENLQDKKQNNINSLPSKEERHPINLYNHLYGKLKIILISLIMPAFNEEKALGPLLDRTRKVLQNITQNYEIIVIDDGSKDKTLHICREKCVTIIHNQNNWGKGYALREGFKYARGKIIVTMDSDGDHKPEEIPLLIQPIINKSVDVVFGTRFRRKNHQLITSVINTFGNKLFNFLIQCLTNHKFTDSQCGFRAYRNSILKKINFKSNRYSIDTEMLIALTKQSVRMQEVAISSPVTYYRKSNLNRLRDGLEILYKILKSSFKK